MTRHGRPGNPATEPQTSISGLAPVSAPPAPDSRSSNIPAKPTVVHITVSSPSAPSVNSPGRPSIELPPANGGSPTAKPAAAPVTTARPVPPPSGAAAVHTLQPALPPNGPGPANKAQPVSLPNQESDARHHIIVTSLPQHHQSPQPQPIATSPAPQITVGGSVVTADSSSNFIIEQGPAAQTLVPGGPAVTHSGNVISLAPSGNSIVIEASTQDIAPITPPPSPLITFAGQTLTANSASEFLINGQKLAPAASAIVHNGQTISIAPQGSEIVINGYSQAIQPTNGRVRARYRDSV